MGAEWRERALGELCSLKYGKFVAKKNLDGGEYPVFSGYGVVGYHSEYLYEDPQLVVVCRGVGGSGDVKMSPARCWITNLAIVVTPKSTSDILASFLYWALQSSNRSGWISGSAQHQVTIAHLEQHRVRFPSLDQQRVIAHILCALDDKIELNRRMSQTLEEMARALFKSWFVDFDPVHAKAAGKKPFGMDEATAALFPDSFEDSELGRIPNGWRVMPLDEVANFKNGLALQKYRPEEGGARLPVVKIAQLRTGRADSAEWARADIDSECVLQDGDVVFSWSGSLMVGLWCGGEAALNQHLFKVTSALHPRWFFYHWVIEHLAEFQRIASAKATTMGHIQRHHLSSALCVVPNQKLIEGATAYVAPYLERVIKLRLESRTLAELRDALLPKLLSGELRVEGAERKIGAVA